jgi:hypothetical protein
LSSSTVIVVRLVELEGYLGIFRDELVDEDVVESVKTSVLVRLDDEEDDEPGKTSVLICLDEADDGNDEVVNSGFLDRSFCICTRNLAAGVPGAGKEDSFVRCCGDNGLLVVLSAEASEDRADDNGVSASAISLAGFRTSAIRLTLERDAVDEVIADETFRPSDGGGEGDSDEEEGEDSDSGDNVIDGVYSPSISCSLLVKTLSSPSSFSSVSSGNSSSSFSPA